MSAATQDTAIRTGRVARATIYLVLILFALFYLLPLYVMLVNSVKPLSEITGGGMMSLPQVWTFEPWQKAWSTAQIGVEPTGLRPYFWNSISMVVPWMTLILWCVWILNVRKQLLGEAICYGPKVTLRQQLLIYGKPFK